MPVTVSAKQDIPACPAGLYLAVAVDVLDLGIVSSDLYGDKPMLRIYWQIAGEMDPQGHPYEVSRRYTKSLHAKSALRKDLVSWRGREFTDEELRGFVVDTVIGASAQIQVQNVTKEGVTYANVMSVLPLMKGQPRVAFPAGYIRREDRPDYVPPSTTPKPHTAPNVDEEDAVPF
jgi:hypothetical protein